MCSVIGGRRDHVSVGSVLQFVTGADEEPVLGFKISTFHSFSRGGDFISSFCKHLYQLPAITLSSACLRCQPQNILIYLKFMTVHLQTLTMACDKFLYIFNSVIYEYGNVGS